MALASPHFSELSFLGSVFVLLTAPLFGFCYWRVPTELFVWLYEEVPGEDSSTLMAPPIFIPLTANLVLHLSPFLYATPLNRTLLNIKNTKQMFIRIWFLIFIWVHFMSI